MRKEFLRVSVVSAAVLCCALSIASAQETSAEGSSQYKIDWNGGFLEVTAVGASDPDKAINQGDAMKQADITACDLAYEKLAEIIGGVSITSNVSYRDLFKRDATAKEKVEAYVKGSRALKRKVDVLEDGSALATCVRGVRLKGSDSIAAKTFSIPAVKQVIKESAAAVPDLEPAASLEPGVSMEIVPVPAKKAHTGLIVDVRGLTSFKTGLTVKIVSGSGQVVYSADVISEDRLARGEMVKYSLSEEDARKSADRVGANPLVIKAASVIEKSPETVAIPAAEAQRVLSEDARAGFLKKGNVIFII